MGKPTEYLINLPKTGRPHDVKIPEVWYPGVHDHNPHCTSSRIYDAILGVRAIVIHATAGGSSEGAMSVMKAHKASWHWLVPDEDEAEHKKLVWACAPEARAAWHVRNSVHNPLINGGANKVNHWSLGIEVVNRQDKNKTDRFSDWQVEVTAKIVRYCWAKYPNLEQIVSHALLDPTRRSDPGEIFPWRKFEKLILDDKKDLPSNFVSSSAKPMDKIVANNSIDLCCMSV